ncbi:MAG: histidinol dehydrogenase [Rhodospirillales bacterium]
MPKRLDFSSPDFETNFAEIVAAKREGEADVGGVVSNIINDVKARGDEALFDYTARFDRFELTAGTLRVAKEDIVAAFQSCEEKTVSALKFAAARIEDYHRRQIPQDFQYTDSLGVRLGQHWKPLSAVGLYVPGGTAAYPTSVLMNAIPAKVAGVERIAMTVPATGGTLNPLVLAAAHIVGVDEIFRIGGAQAVAALAYGTQTIRPVDKIVGPGNAYVAEAKRRVFGVVGIDMIAGPSEILVVADAENDPTWIAADLLSQAEHDESAQSILITDSSDFADKVVLAIEAHLERLPRRKIAERSWAKYGTIILVERLEDAVPLIDRLAPEHLELAIEDADDMAGRIRNAGAMFLGRYTPEAVGDYIAGPNHVLPTARSARFSSGLGVLDFLKRNSTVKCDRAGLEQLGPLILALAEAEGLDAHALSVGIRLNKSSPV